MECSRKSVVFPLDSRVLHCDSLAAAPEDRVAPPSGGKLRESHSCASSFLPPDEITRASPSMAGRRASGPQVHDHRRVQSTYRRQRVKRHGSVTSPAHSAMYLDHEGRLRLANADRSASTSALDPPNEPGVPTSSSTSNWQYRVRNHGKDDEHDRQAYYGRNWNRHSNNRPQSPEFYHSATSSTGSTPPCSPYEQMRCGSASGYRRRFLPATPTRASRVLKVRRDPGSGISSSASAVIPLSQFHTSPLQRLRSESEANNNNNDLAFRVIPASQHPNERAEGDYFDCTFEESFDCAVSKPLISPSVARKLPDAHGRLQPRSSSSSLSRRNTAPSRQRPHVEIRGPVAATDDDERMTGASSQTNIGFHETSYSGPVPSRRIMPAFPHALSAEHEGLSDDEAEHESFLRQRGGSMRVPESRRALPKTHYTRTSWKSLNKGQPAKKSTVFLNPGASRFQMSNEEEVEALFQSETLRTAGRRTLPFVSPTSRFSTSPTWNHADEEAEAPLLSHPTAASRQFRPASDGNQTNDSDLRAEQIRRRSWDDKPIRSRDLARDAGSSYCIGTQPGDDIVIVNTNNNNCLREDAGSEMENGCAFNADTKEKTCGAIDIPSRNTESICYYQGVGEDDSPTSQGIAIFSAAKYKRDLFPPRSPRRGSSPRTRGSSGDISRRISDTSDPRRSPGSASLLSVERCVVHANSNADVESVTETRNNRDPSTKIDSTWC